LADFLQFKMICQPAVFMKRDVLKRIGYLDSSYHFFLDHQLWIRFAREIKFIHHPRVWAVSRYHPNAKNVTMASQCGDEVYRILNWAETQTDLADIILRNYQKTWAGAYQIIARYLLDGGKSGQAFLTYWKAFRTWFPSVKGYWHRFLFSGLSTLGLGFLGKWYYSLKSQKRLEILKEKSLQNWPGLDLD